jgi:TetR/AcrR family transcriptional regulator, tetracycline repressor protein
LFDEQRPSPVLGAGRNEPPAQQQHRSRPERASSTTPADHFPRSAAAASTMAGYISTGQYLWGLRRVLDGITARPAASR